MKKFNMSALRHLIIISLLSSVNLFTAQSASATALDIGTSSGSGCCQNLTRGYWFTAPVDFTITGLSLPGGPVTDSTIEVLKFNITPPQFSSTTNDFTSMGYWEDVASVTTSLAFSAGDIVGILGWADGFTTYRDTNGDYDTSLGGQAITLARLGFQDLGQAHDVWTETGTIGMINMEYTTTVVEPAPLALLGLGLLGLGLARKRRG
ncbi:hypothetical protein [Paremcibacter congregatus]|uniref:PEP-CTERM protein-sorting domain-containing protein n=1 Tax=Paremcibacter congregatus TaxID=2043170 RepID=A0A2G4YV85_9PROT|nr:hypothetical protein [Paremcibacter congregatus]PHZ86150.1 hypothetical protein CRD36_05625 [Paremcibacter congregatus]QDE27114.1 hypothetical protein FIV45_07395 [Paremcibacter congregatus]